jgi:hypothetical protein
LQGSGIDCTRVPLNTIALSTLPRHIITQGTAIRSLMRNLGGSVGIRILVAILAQNTEAVHSRLVEVPPSRLLRHPAQAGTQGFQLCPLAPLFRRGDEIDGGIIHSQL